MAHDVAINTLRQLINVEDQATLLDKCGVLGFAPRHECWTCRGVSRLVLSLSSVL